MLAVRLAQLLAPLVWWGKRRTAARLLVFAQAERASMIDLRLAARATTSAARAAAYLRHADDEARHCTMFVRRAGELLREVGRPAPTTVHVDTDTLFDRLGELDFLAFVHHGEARGRRQFEAHARWLASRGRTRDAALFDALIADERRHETYTGELLAEIAGDPRQASRALARVRRWELGRQWLRHGRAIGSRVYLVATLLLYLAVIPLGLVIRWTRPIPRGFVDFQGKRPASPSTPAKPSRSLPLSIASLQVTEPSPSSRVPATEVQP